MYLQFIDTNYIIFPSLPNRIRLANGMTRTNLDELSVNELNDLGVFEYTDATPSYDTSKYAPTGEYTFDHTNRTFVNTLYEIPRPVAKQFTQLEYQSLYTLDELVAIEVAAQTDPVLRVFQRMQQAASYISLADSRTVQGMQLLVSKNLLTQTRYDEIMSHIYDR